MMSQESYEAMIESLRARVKELEEDFEHQAAAYQSCAKELRETRKEQGEPVATVDCGILNWIDGMQFDEGDLYRNHSHIPDGRNLAHELMGIAAEMDNGQEFDATCKRTLSRVIETLLTELAPKPGEKT